jgi:3-oxoacyl-[acyl-carrier protein] reductase
VNLELKGRVALVTGSSAGIGRATALQFAAEGASVMVTYRRNRDAAEATATAIRAMGAEAAVAALDLADPDSITETVRGVLDRWGRIDVLVNNAVEFVMTSDASRLFEEVPPEAWQQPLRANLEGAMWATQSVVPAMRRQGWGRIVSISSVAVSDGFLGFSWYAMAKAALHGFTRTLAKEIGPEGILVNIVMPGGTLTERIRDELTPERLHMQASSLPIRRLPMPDEVARIVVFLCSSANTVMTGEIVRVSGGRR